MRLIDADAFEKWLRKARENCYANEIHDCEDESQMTNINDELYFSTQSFIDTMKYRPTIDAEPVRHGEWIPIMHQDIFGKEFVSHHKCSVCEEDALCECANYDAEEELSNYCPNCGAKMDEEVQDGTD